MHVGGFHLVPDVSLACGKWSRSQSCIRTLPQTITGCDGCKTKGSREVGGILAAVAVVNTLHLLPVVTPACSNYPSCYVCVTIFL
jgi:hypothetical protein